MKSNNKKSQIITFLSIALANVFGKTFDARGLAAAHLGVDLGDVEYVDMNTFQFGKHGVLLAPRLAHTNATFIGVPR